MILRAIAGMCAVLATSSGAAFACDPIAEEKAFIASLQARHFSGDHLQLFLGKSEALRQEISRSIKVGDDEMTCEKIGEAIEMLRSFDPY